ncbi:DUF4352 domain-containing protein [Paractinoplanes durhamensis]|uniref:DUF4352 domain-containing protein n=1 Tax=Paractinoplanes durhamensis TaxID=113563 RepID=A0ABQ3Z3B7_9ACTN|nr:DUF4352 domain-containing protein [Actinoplanes durhamensis]GIE04306.1 hypothetical protein Adu01nite_56560 [Actinoplanes durhamensis]
MNKRRPWVVLVVAVLAVAGVLVWHRSADETVKTTKSPAVGTPVTQDGIFEYTVTAHDCGVTAIEGATATGQFCTVAIIVHNLSDTARKPGIAFAKAYDTQGTAHPADAVAEVRIGTHLLDDLAAGASITDELVYDVPKTTSLTSVVLRESTGSAGITVPLG